MGNHTVIFFLSFLTQGREQNWRELLDSWDSALPIVPQTQVSYFSLASASPPTPLLFSGFVPVPLPVLAAHVSAGTLPPPKTLGGFPDLTFSLDPQMTYKEAQSLFSSFRSSGGSEIC